MKVTDNTNGLLTIQANMNKEGDYNQAMKIAQKMVELEYITGMEIIIEDSEEGYIQIGALWGKKQAADMLEAYTDAKKAA